MDAFTLVLERLERLAAQEDRSTNPADHFPRPARTDLILDQAQRYIDLYKETDMGVNRSIANRLEKLRPAPARRRHYCYERVEIVAVETAPAIQPGLSSDWDEIRLYLACQFVVLHEMIRPGQPLTFDLLEDSQEEIHDFFDWVSDQFPINEQAVYNIFDDGSDFALTCIPIEWFGFGLACQANDDPAFEGHDAVELFFAWLFLAMDFSYRGGIGAVVVTVNEHYRELLRNTFGFELPDGVHTWHLPRYLRDHVVAPAELASLHEYASWIQGDTGWGWLDHSWEEVFEGGGEAESWSPDNFQQNVETWQECGPVWQRIRAFGKWAKPDDHFQQMVAFVQQVVNNMATAGVTGAEDDEAAVGEGRPLVDILGEMVDDEGYTEIIPEV